MERSMEQMERSMEQMRIENKRAINIGPEMDQDNEGWDKFPLPYQSVERIQCIQ